MGVRRETQFVLFGVQLGEKHHRREKRRDAGHEERRKDTGQGRTCKPARRSRLGALSSPLVGEGLFTGLKLKPRREGSSVVHTDSSADGGVSDSSD